MKKKYALEDCTRLISDFLSLGSLRLFARILNILRSLFILFYLSPKELGDYAVLLLYVYYFGMLDFGILFNLERDLPYLQSRGMLKKYRQTADLGRSVFFSLSCLASLLIIGGHLLGVFKEGIAMSFFLAGYLFLDQIYRAFESNARVAMKYREVGIGEAIVSFIGLLLLVLLPTMRLYGLFLSFIGGSIVGIWYFCRIAPIQFKLVLNWRAALAYCKRSFPLAVYVYATEIFDTISLTILAVYLSREEIGKYVFAFRIFQMGLFMFPLMFREVMRTRMYRSISEQESKGHAVMTWKPLLGYITATSVIWLILYWWAAWFVGNFAPFYINSVLLLKILTATLPLLGVIKLYGDFLVSKKINKQFLVLKFWAVGFLVQVLPLLMMGFFHKIDLFFVSMVYAVAVCAVCFLVVREVFFIDQIPQNPWKIVLLLTSPLLLCFGNVFIFKLFHFVPLSNLKQNLVVSGGSLGLYFLMFLILFFTIRRVKGVLSSGKFLSEKVDEIKEDLVF